MAKVTIEIDEKYAGVLALCAVGTSYVQTFVTTTAVVLEKCNHISLDETGHWKTEIVQE